MLLGWGGRASDERVTENSGLLSLLSQIQAERGFDMADSVGLCLATFRMPAY